MFAIPSAKTCHADDIMLRDQSVVNVDAKEPGAARV